MENKAIITRIDKTILSFINGITEPYKNDHDLKTFHEILNGTRFTEGRTVFKLRIGSKRRLNYKMLDEPMLLLPYNEFKIQVRITSRSLNLMLSLFQNEVDKIEGFSYYIDDETDSEIAEETWVLPEGNNGRRHALLFAEILQLHKLNREMTVISELEPTQEVMDIHKRFDELMQSAEDDEIDWALSNELETEEKIRVLQNLSPDRKLQILNNLKNGN
jgi:hypothetical protein